jgi:hypothetical protein
MFLLRSIHQLRPALESLKDEKYEDLDKTDAKFKTMIPSPLTFQIIEQIIPCMEKACQLSEMLSADDKPTLHQVISVNNVFFSIIFVLKFMVISGIFIVFSVNSVFWRNFRLIFVIFFRSSQCSSTFSPIWRQGQSIVLLKTMQMW